MDMHSSISLRTSQCLNVFLTFPSSTLAPNDRYAVDADNFFIEESKADLILQYKPAGDFSI